MPHERRRQQLRKKKLTNLCDRRLADVCVIVVMIITLVYVEKKVVYQQSSKIDNSHPIKIHEEFTLSSPSLSLSLSYIIVSLNHFSITCSFFMGIIPGDIISYIILELYFKFSEFFTQIFIFFNFSHTFLSYIFFYWFFRLNF